SFAFSGRTMPITSFTSTLLLRPAGHPAEAVRACRYPGVQRNGRSGLPVSKRRLAWPCQYRYQQARSTARRRLLASLCPRPGARLPTVARGPGATTEGLGRCPRSELHRDRSACDRKFRPARLAARDLVGALMASYDPIQAEI